MGVEKQDRRRTWLDDADSFISNNHWECARAVYDVCLKTDHLKAKKGVWEKAVDLERKHGDSNSLMDLLVRATEAVPKTRLFWLMRAKECWNNGDIDGARGVLETAFTANRDSEEIWLAAVKLEYENERLEDARRLLE